MATAKKKKAGWFRYIKEAFTYRWNLLLFGGAFVCLILAGAAAWALLNLTVK
jgi:hypothetical protein